jgi:hypothetical protein
MSFSTSSLRGWLLAPLAALLLGLAGCGGGGGGESAANNGPGGSSGGSSSQCAADCGEVLVALTDADGDFLSYSVDVLSLTLKKANGDVVETLPSSTRVDFAQLVDLTEFFTAATIPYGAYVEGSIRLDFSDAEVTVEVGGTPKAATVQDEDGEPLGIVDLQIVFDNTHHVVVAPGRPAFLQLDFDLAATHTVDIAATPVMAVARPLIVATIEPVQEKEMRVRGPLVSVDTTAGTYTIDVRPFLHRTARFGRMTVHTTSETAFEIDGVPYTGDAGLQAMAALEAGTPTAAFGAWALEPRKFTAERVHAGTSVPGDRFDVLWGNVTSRQGDTLIVRGGTLIRRSGAVSFVRDDITLLVGSGTGVTRDGRGGNELDAGALSVGQRIHAFGQVSTNDAGELTLDATAGRVRMHLTRLWGTVKSSLPGMLTLDLDAIDGRRAGIFDFAGTGMSAAMDADPDNYEIATGQLNLNLFPNTAPTRVYGFVTPFGMAPPDFEGRTVVDFARVRAVMGVSYGLQGTAAPFLSVEAGGIVLDHTNEDIGLRRYIRIGPRLIDITELASPLTIAPLGERGLYAIGAGRRVEVFASFERFATRLNEKLGAGSKVVSLSGGGGYDAASNTLSAREVHVTMTVGQ